LNKSKILFFGWVTLLLMPLPAYFALHYFKGANLYTFFQVANFKTIPVLYGLEFGIVYAFLALLLLQAPVFKTIPLPIDKLVKDLNLNYVDAIFLSLCAGIGEELLFRSGIQTFLGVWITSFLFVAVHGYFSLKKIKMSLYGLVVLPFILVISYGFEHFGLWFSISAHFAYDLVLFFVLIQSED
jgi:membrane protease YdiL (CAAX protease family)